MARPPSPDLDQLPLSQFVRGMGGDPVTQRSVVDSSRRFPRDDLYAEAVARGALLHPPTSRAPSSYARAGRLAQEDEARAAWEAAAAKVLDTATPSERAKLLAVPGLAVPGSSDPTPRLFEAPRVPAGVSLRPSVRPDLERRVQEMLGAPPASSSSNTVRDLTSPWGFGRLGDEPVTERSPGERAEYRPRFGPREASHGTVPKYAQRASAQAARAVAVSPYKRSQHECSKRTLEDALTSAGGNKSRAAELAGMTRNGFYRAMARVGLPT